VTVTVAGAGMAGLVAAARLRQLGQEVTVREKGTRPGGSMLLSSGVIWRHRTLDDFRAECPGGDADLQQLIVDQLDDRLDWLESLGAPVAARETGNPLTVGRRLAPLDLVAALLRHTGDVLLGEPLEDAVAEPLVLATGGFGAALARRLSLPLRASPWSEGDALVLARDRGATTSAGMDEFYGRALPVTPAELPEEAWVRLGQVYGRHALVLDEAGAAIDIGHPAWHETDLVQEIARRPGGRAWFLVAEEALDRPVRDTTVAERIEAARAAGGTVVDPGELSFPVPPGYRYAIHVTASVTHTIGGLVVDRDARVLCDDGTPIDGLYAAGVDAGGIATGGYSSGLAAALVLGSIAAESIAEASG
jgi:fumarate reductase flavoprotein subunit